MAEESSVKGPIEQECHPKCTSYWGIYEECKKRISSYDTLDIHKLQHIAEHHGMKVQDVHHVWIYNFAFY